jgi:hypothetical protein
MRKLFLPLALVLAASCATTENAQRKISSLDKDLTGTYLGVADYGPRRGLNKKAMRIYFHPIEGRQGHYDVVLLEYVDLLKMAPSYIASNKLPFIARRTGFLKNITSNISTYEASPGEAENTYELRPLTIQGDQIVVNADAPARILKLSTKEGLKNPLEGATISKARADEPKEIFFPAKDDGKKNGIQYGTAKLAYEKAKLESTWRKNYLRGPYLSQYYRRDDIVLNLTSEGGVHGANFVLNPKYAKLSEKKRAQMFTHPDSAFLQGEFTASEPRDGMFLSHSVNADEKTANIIKGRIGLFIDIFDATKSLGQDVVELVYINPENPTDFLMYYEDPENGEGKENEAR